MTIEKRVIPQNVRNLFSRPNCRILFQIYQQLSGCYVDNMEVRYHYLVLPEIEKIMDLIFSEMKHQIIK